jgi:hypothetical protein
MNPNFETIPGFDRANSARSAGENNVSREQSHVGGNETDQLKAVEDELARVRVLAQLPVLK